MRTYARWTLVVMLVVVGLSGVASAQSALAVADAGAFMGGWTLGLDTPQGALSMELILKDAGGKVDASISAEPMLPGVTKITDVTKDGTKLVLKYVLDVQGMSIPAVITLIPEGDKWKAHFDFADGQFQTEGTAAKKG